MYKYTKKRNKRTKVMCTKIMINTKSTYVETYTDVLKSDIEIGIFIKLKISVLI